MRYISLEKFYRDGPYVTVCFHRSVQVGTAFGDMDLFSTIYRYRIGSKYVELNAVLGFG